MQPNVNYTEMLMQEYGMDKMAQALILKWRLEGNTDEDIYKLLESFY